MPCYSKIQTILIDLTTIEAAVKSLGIQITKRTPNLFILKRGDEQVEISRTREGERFTTSYASSEGELMKTIVPAYAKERVKQFARSKGYTVSAGTKPGQFVLTKYS
jgi:hypothetical protein